MAVVVSPSPLSGCDWLPNRSSFDLSSSTSHNLAAHPHRQLATSDQVFASRTAEFPGICFSYPCNARSSWLSRTTVTLTWSTSVIEAAIQLAMGMTEPIW